jgi:predicted DNA-binding transcriptional regulator AlpA/transcriptional regulator with XRE-family HTH domain
MSTDTITNPTEAPEAETHEEAIPEQAVSLDIGSPAPEPVGGTHYAPAEVAGFLGLKSTQTIYRWVKDGKIVPAVQAGDRLIAFSKEQVDELRTLRRQSSGGGSRGGKGATPNVFSEAFANWRLNSGHSREVVAGALRDEDDPEGKGMSAAQVGRWEHGFSLPTADAAERIVEQAPELAVPYIKAKAEAARAASARRAERKQEAEQAEAPTPEQAAAAATAA